MRKILLSLIIRYHFSQSIYNYIPQTNHNNRIKYRIAGIWYLQMYAKCIIIINIILLPQTNDVSRVLTLFCNNFLLQHKVHLMLLSHLKYFYLHITPFPRICAEPSMAAVHSSSLSCLRTMLLRCFLKILEMVPVNPTIIIIFKYHISCNATVSSSYFNNFRLLSLTNIC